MQIKNGSHIYMKVMRTWIKITEGDKENGIRALEKIAIPKPVCIKNKLLDYAFPNYQKVDERMTMDYLREVEAVSVERCKTLISKSNVPTGEYDFYFEWYDEPTQEHLQKLEEEVKDALENLDIEYDLVNK
jgi:hypothetical protein